MAMVAVAVVVATAVAVVMLVLPCGLLVSNTRAYGLVVCRSVNPAGVLAFMSPANRIADAPVVYPSTVVGGGAGDRRRTDSCVAEH